MKLLSKKFHLGYYLFNEIIVKLILFISIPIFTNISDKSEFGKFSLYISALPLFSIFIDLSQRISIKRLYIDNPNKIYKLLITINTFSLIWFLVLYFTSYIFNIIVIDTLYTQVLLFNAFFLTIIESYLSYLQISKQVILYNILYFFRQAFPYIIAILVLILYKTNNSFIFSLIQAVIFILIVIYIIRTLTNRLKRFFYFDFYLLKYSMPIGIFVIPGVISSFFINFADRYMINYFFSTKEVAEYSVAYTVALIFPSIFLALNKAWQPFILNNLKENKITIIQKYTLLYILFMLIIAIILILSSKWILIILSNETYLVVVDIIPIIIIGFFFYFLYTIYSNIAFYHKRMFFFSLPAIVAATINLILNFLLLPKYGYKIAAWTTMASYFIEFMVIYFISKYLFNINIISYKSLLHR